MTGTTRRGRAAGYIAFALFLGFPFLVGFVAGYVAGQLP